MDCRKLDLHVCTADNLEEIMALQSEIIEQLSDKDLLRDNTREMFLLCMQTPNLTLGLYDGDILAALAIMFDGTGTDEDLGVDLQTAKVEKNINFKLILVRKEYRGHHFQRIMMSILERLAYKMGYTHMSTTVSPKNKHSLQNMIDAGYHYDHEALKYNNLDRSVYYKEFYKEVEKRNEQIETDAITVTERSDGSNYLIGCLNQEDYFHGTVGSSILVTGDILEYVSSDGNTTMYGIYVNNTEPVIYMGAVSGQKGEVLPFAEQIRDFSLKNIWFATK